MQKDFEGFAVYHFHQHSHSKIRLFVDNRDKLVYLKILAKLCLASEDRLFFFEFLNGHCHFLLKIAWPSNEKPSLDWLEDAAKSFLYRVNREYGCYYRKRHHYSGHVFSRNLSNHTHIPHKKAFINAMKYIQHNATSLDMYQIFEDNAFNSFNFYLASFVQNPEIRGLPALSRVTSSVDFLQVFDAIDFTLALKMLGSKRSLKTNILKFIEIHHKLLRDRDAQYKHTNSTDSYGAHSVAHIYRSPELLQIADSGGHEVWRFIRAIPTATINRENCEAHFRTFSAFFPWSDLSLKDSFRRIRQHYNLEFTEFVRSMKCKVSERTISELTGISRDALRIRKRIDDSIFLP